MQLVKDALETARIAYQFHPTADLARILDLLRAACREENERQLAEVRKLGT